MKTFDANYRLLEEMYQDEYYPDFLVDKVKTELQKVITLLEGGGSDSGKGLVKQSQPQKHNQLHNSNHFSPMIWAKNSSTVLNSIFRRTESWDYSANY